MAFNFMDLLGSVMQGTSSPVTTSRMNNAGSSIGDLLGSFMGSSSSPRQSSSGGGMGDLLGSLMGAGQNVTRKVGGDNLAAAGLGALLGALTGKSQSTTANSLGGGLMGLLGMMAYKALTKKSSGTQAPAQTQAYTQPTQEQQSSDAEIILLAMIDAAKSDGQVDADEFNKIINNVKSSGIGQDGVNYVLQKLQGPMETAKIVQACRGRPELAAQVYSASLMAIDVDTQAEKKYLDTLAKALGLPSDVTTDLQEMTGSSSEDFIC
ncbi:MAG: tellurite resistance TerB family protein [Synergistaceae bacterium]|nr:tellurite resistance TerB family protein [Synergistaceae bacterium]